MRPKRAFVLGLLMLVAGSFPTQANAPTEYEIKAAFLYNFAKFVEWPPEAFKNSGDTFVVGILGQDPFGKELEETLSGKTVQDKKLVFKTFATLQDVTDCHVLFISPSEEKNLPFILNSLKGPPILTVSDVNRFIQRGGMVGFTLEDNKVRFNINLTAAESAGLKISSQLLKLAKTVKVKPSAGND